ncbi:uncharacterized protein F4812DRAFT_379391 [Daldinia caldariorum]|uniref:uncharacterized protein n=1 Tax=Daldinia caldariorum TaxID=326644 RepID=UPI002007CC23|nr:uncharacterized protein F4812DRAFT_379391 [Daldinia caldariorum]KAI1467846.1 hypothetical protein F4812DRAFT_379391 [Daldinia caldariorum]
MASRNAREKRFTTAPSEVDNDNNAIDTGTEASATDGRKRKRRRRNANVYDAVAGRVTTTLPLGDGTESESDEFDIPSHHARTSRDYRRDPTLAPEEVLFRRIRAPVRFAEKDIYHAHEALRDGGRGILPDSDMLKAIHSYSSHFYAALAATREGGEAGNSSIDEHSMDETALLAFGILLEEASRSALGKTGDLVFTEGVTVRKNGELGVGGNAGNAADNNDHYYDTVDFKASVTGR